jgi:HTH-type transcriptional regulator/antitoxin HigA
MDLKPITNKSQYETSLAELNKLMDRNPKTDSDDAKNVVLLAVLIEKYEKERFKFEKPTPIEAILFRMEEQGLTRTDLIPYIGNKSKVSEILSGKRPLSLNMIKSLSVALDISADILIGSAMVIPEEPEFELNKLPLKEMITRGWIESKSTDHMEVLRKFTAPFRNSSALVFFRKSTTPAKNIGIVYAWLSRILNLSYEKVPEGKAIFRKEFITKSFLKEVANLSYFDNGPLLAQELLRKNGILLVVEKYLNGLRVDGASLLRDDGIPVIGISLRHDRLDNFWFTLIHELAHVFRHLSKNNPVFYDDLDNQDMTSIFEREADFLAQEAFIPLNIWKNSSVLKEMSERAVKDLSMRLRIHPSLIVGRLQRELNNFKIMRKFLGEGTVREMFGC